jgi:predicted porin
MKKTLIALAVLAAAGAASAQSSVTLFGIVDATVQRIDNSGGSAVTRLHNSGESSSRLGFRGTEDLGGGMSAQFWLEAGVNNDDGTGQASSANNQGIGAFNSTTGANVAVRSGTQGLTFNRRSTVALAGGFGEIRLGRDYTPQFSNQTVFDPFGTVGVGTNQLLNGVGNAQAGGIVSPTAVRASNSIGYFLPSNLGGFYGALQYYRGENLSTAANSGDGNGYGFRFGYAAGPVNVALASARTTYARTAIAAGLPSGDVRQTNLAGSWNFGVATLIGELTRDSMESTVGRTQGRGWMVATTVPVGAGLIKGSVAQYTTDIVAAGPDWRARKFAIGYVHNLSKRTAVYTTYARVNNSNGSAMTVLAGAGNPVVNGSSTGYDLGVRHSF